MTSLTSPKKAVIWRLRRGMDRRFRSGHPWIYSNELMESPKGISPGAPVELHDAGGTFLAYGYGNPQSLIAFRALTRNPQEIDPFSSAFLLNSLLKARSLRIASGFSNFSYRLCFGEADGIPGLVIDRYRLETGQVFVVQAHTAGAQQLCQNLSSALQSLVEWESNHSSSQEPSWGETAILLKNDMSVRKLEGLSEEKTVILKSIDHVDFKSAPILIRCSWDDSKSLLFYVDLLEGQKTGFFLDQFSNIQLAVLKFQHLLLSSKDKNAPLKILDLCSYVGQWSVQLGTYFQKHGIAVEVLAIDASQRSLEFAEKNCNQHGIPCKTWKADVLKDLTDLQSAQFDLVISDPPALIKNRKDIPAGTHAYLQLNTQAIRLTRSGGGIICCSCSALLEEDAFKHTLAKASQRNLPSLGPSTAVEWIRRGSPSTDHPVRLEFSEGNYLKSWMGFKI